MLRKVWGKSFCIVLLCYMSMTKFALYANEGILHFIKSPELSVASVGYCLLDATTGRMIHSYDEERALLPASVLKVVTTATALDLLGPDYRFATKVGYTGTVDKDGILQGNLIIRGGGDPMLGSEFSRYPQDHFLNKLFVAVQAAGIKGIKGRVVCDDSLFDTEGVSHKWLWEDMGNYFAAGSYGLNYSDNMYRLILRSGTVGTAPQILGTKPEIPDLMFSNYLRAAANAIDSVYIYGAPFSGQRYLYGTLPANRSTFTVKGDIPDPALYLGQVVSGMFVSKGIKVQGKPITVRLLRERGETFSYFGMHQLLSFSSDKLIDIITVTNKRSNNLFAETLLKQIALTRYPIASASRGIEVVSGYWREKGIDVSSLMLADGSGLSPVNRISAGAVARILFSIKNGKNGDSFLRTLPKAGEEGTVRNLLKGSRLNGSLYLKSGSIMGVQCFAGYYIGQKPYIIVLMVNNFTGPRSILRRDIERLFLSELSGR